MAVLAESFIPGLTKEQYDGLIGQFEPLVKQAPGFIAHFGSEIPGGWKVTELWESSEQFFAWIQGTVLPAALAAGMNPPILTVSPGHHVIVK